MPSFSIWRNSFFAAANFSPSNQRKRHDKGGPLVTMWCSTSPEGRLGNTLELLTTAGKSANSFLKLSAPTADAAGATAEAATARGS